MAAEPHEEPASTFVIDGAQIDGIEDLYAQLNTLLMADEGWELGASLDALNDVLYRFSPNGETGPAVFVWTDHGHSRESLGRETTVRWLDAKLRRPDVFNTAVIRAQRDAVMAGEGKTYFELVREVFDGHDPYVRFELS